MNTLITTIKNTYFSSEKPNKILIGDFTEKEHEIILSLREPFNFICVEKGRMYYTFSIDFYIEDVLVLKLKRNTFILTELRCTHMFKLRDRVICENNEIQATHSLRHPIFSDIVSDGKPK